MKKPLSNRHIEIISLVAQGFTNDEIGVKLFIATRTVETHRRDIQELMKVKNSPEMVYVACREGLLDLSFDYKPQTLNGHLITIQNKNYILKLI